jgi:cell wall-associated NlpC family hydrolase
MSALSDWLRIPYLAHGRDLSGCDCWGLARLARHALRGDWLPSHGAIDPDDKAAMTEVAGQMVGAGFRECSPRPGALAAIWRGQLCLHVAIVIEAEGRLAVLETNRATGPRWMRIKDFEACYLRVTYHDSDLPL